MTHPPSTLKHESSDKHGSGAVTTNVRNQLVQKTVEVPQEQIEVTTLRVTSQNAPMEQLNAAATECTDSAPREEKCG